MIVKCITLWSPWGQLIADRRKKIETRSWGTRYRGPLGIHAGAALDEEFAIECGYNPRAIAQRKIIAFANLSDCIEMTPAFIRKQSKDERRFGDFAPGRFAWVFSSVWKLDTPIPAVGKQSIWQTEIDLSELELLNKLR